MKHEKQELEQNGRDEGMERVEVTKAKEQEEGAKAGAGRKLNGELCPVEPLALSDCCEAVVQDADRHHLPARETRS
jgi:hypothetical protein